MTSAIDVGPTSMEYAPVSLGTLISIIVPIYNVSEYLVQCLESIQKQTYKNLQIILVDDGSTDDSGAICDQYACKDGRIEVIHQKNEGLVAARKRGLEKARGEYIGFVDGDDYIDIEMYEVLIHELKSYNADFIHTGYYRNEKKLVPFKTSLVEFRDDASDFVLENIINLQYYINPNIWSKLFKAELIKKCYMKLPDWQNLGEDLMSVCRCTLEAKRIFLLADAFYHYRIREGSLAHGLMEDAVINLGGLYTCLRNLFVEYGCYEKMQVKLGIFMKKEYITRLSKIGTYKFGILLYRYPEINRLRNMKIILYGAGAVGRSYYSQIRRYQSIKLVAWMDRSSLDIPDSDIKTEEISAISTIDFDAILIAIMDETEAHHIRQDLCGMGIENDKILWSVPEVNV